MASCCKLTPFCLECVQDGIDCLESVASVACHGIANPARFMIVAMLGLFALWTTDNAEVGTAMKDE